MSNTKPASFGLTKTDMKSDIAFFESKGCVFNVNPQTGITVCFRREFPTSRVVQVSVAIMSPDEYKFRPTVGKYIAGYALVYDEKYTNIPVESAKDFLAALGFDIY